MYAANEPIIGRQALFAAVATAPATRENESRVRELESRVDEFQRLVSRLGEQVARPAGARLVEVTPSAEAAWLDEHRDSLRERLPGEWVAVHGSELVSHGADLDSVMSEAKARGIDLPMVVMIPRAMADRRHR
jgi:predicted trehalose synthase